MLDDGGEEENNIFKIISGGKDQDSAMQTQAAEIPQNEYLVIDINGSEHYGDGFLLFTSHHIAIMRDTGNGALPVLVMPLSQVFSAELIEDDEVFDEQQPGG